MFDVVVEYAQAQLKSGLKGIIVFKEKDDEARQKIAKESIEALHTQWVMPNWKQSNEMLRVSTKWDGEAGQRVLDWATYRSQIMENFMRMWDVKDDKGAPVPCTRENMDKLDPSIASALVERFLAKTTVTEKDLGN
jgi:hypothetical protein